MTEKTPTFPNAPIVEAILDIRAKTDEATDLGRLSGFQADLKARYPKRQERSRWSTGLHLKSTGEAALITPKGGPEGYWFTSPDGKQIVQVRVDGFSFSRLRPYENWRKFKAEAKELWSHYVKVVSPLAISRLALRYINRIQIPFPVKDFNDYLITRPEIADDLPHDVVKFFMQVTVPEPKTEAVAIINQSMEPPPGEFTELPVIFDIDVFKSIEIDATSETIWEVFETLRAFKNDVFLKSLTEKAKALFK